MWARRLSELPLLVILPGLAALAMYLPALHALTQRDHDVARPFFYGGTLCLMLTILLGLATMNRRSEDRARADLMAFVLSFALLPVMLALPLHQALRDTTWLNAWFEMVSSLTTTGATVYDPARLAPSLHLWRSLVGWLGGLFILVAALAILAPLNLGGVEVLSGRAPGRRQEETRLIDPSQRIALHLVAVLPVYVGLTLLLWVLLALLGESNLVALTHAMAILSTSGISPVGGLAGSTSGVPGEMIMALFLIYAITRQSLPGSGLPHRRRHLWEDRELRMALAIVVGLSVALMLRHTIAVLEENDTLAARGFFPALWGSLFTCLSFLTTTGFVSSDWDTARFWAGLSSPGLILAGLAMIGGGIATTAGGVKLLRVYALFRQGARELERSIHPNSVGGAGDRMLRRDGVYLAWVFFVLFGVSIAVVVGLLTFLGREFQPALMFTIGALANAGPLVAASGEVGVTQAPCPGGEKLVLALAMVVGRVETIALLALFATNRWRH
jgi:trk system potassium uptake protein